MARSLSEAAQQLADPADARASIRELAPELPDVGFVFPGQGSQYAGMGRGLYDSEPSFRFAFDECCAVIHEQTGENPRDRFFSGDAAMLAQTSVTQPFTFALEYSLAQLWISWGIVPKHLIGHSVGEFVCAVIAGIMTLRDALALVQERGRLMQALPAGSMLSVRLAAADLVPRLPEGVVIAAENAPRACVASGPAESVARLEAELDAADIAARLLVTSHAFHSPMMDPAVEPMVVRAARIAWRRRAYRSCRR